MREVGEVAVRGEVVALGRARRGRRRRGGEQAAGAEAGGGAGAAVAAAAGGAEGGARAGVDAVVHAGEAVGPGRAAGAALLLEAVAMGAAGAEGPQGERAGRAVDGPLEAEGAPVALGDGLDGLHGLVVRRARPEAAGDGIADALLARLALLAEAVVVGLLASGVVAAPLGAWRGRVRGGLPPRRPGMETATHE